MPSPVTPPRQRLIALTSLLVSLAAAAPASAQTAPLPDTKIGSSATPPPEGVDVTLLVVALVAALAIADLTFHAVRSRRRALAALAVGDAVVLEDEDDDDAELAAEVDDQPAIVDEPIEAPAPRSPWSRTPPSGPRERARSRPVPSVMRASVGAARARTVPRGARGPRAMPR